ncbi:MAG: PIG-L family deacetylase [Planctomycetota bacterium]
MRIIVAGPHPDDQELGMGGTIAKLAQQGHDVLLLDITDGEPTPHGSRETRLPEAEAARAALSPDPTQHPASKPIRRLLLDLPNRRVQHTIEARHAVAGVIRAWQAELVFLPYFEDAHPDHIAVTRIVEDARFDAKLTKVDMPTPPPNLTGGPSIDGQPQLVVGPPCYPRRLIYYYCTHLRIVPQPTFVFDISGCVEAKRAAVEAYATQFKANAKNRRIMDWLDAAALFYGSRIGVAAAEPFYLREPLGLADLDALIG